MASKKRLCLFDLDGTLTLPRNAIEKSMLEFIVKLASVADVAIVSGSDYSKVLEQIVSEDVLDSMRYVFTENGVVVREQGRLTHQGSIADHLGEEKCQKLINFILKKFSEIELPVKRGNFVEFRNGIINVSPVGRSCNQAERTQFYEFDKVNKVREKLVEDLKAEFGTDALTYSIGGQISIDIFPNGWDKRYSLKFLDGMYEEIHFFGDKTDPGGNDHEIFEDNRTIGHSVAGPDDTIGQLKKLFTVLA